MSEVPEFGQPTYYQQGNPEPVTIETATAGQNQAETPIQSETVQDAPAELAQSLTNGEILQDTPAGHVGEQAVSDQVQVENSGDTAEQTTKSGFRIQANEGYKFYSPANDYTAIFDDAHRMSGNDSIDHAQTDALIMQRGEYAATQVGDAVDDDKAAILRMITAGALHDLSKVDAIMKPVYESGKFSTEDITIFENIIGDVTRVRAGEGTDLEKALYVNTVLGSNANSVPQGNQGLRTAIMAYATGAATEFPYEMGANQTMEGLIFQASSKWTEQR